MKIHKSLANILKHLSYIYNKIVYNSMIFSLVAINIVLITLIYKSSTLYFIQFSTIIGSIYLSLKLFEHYQSDIFSPIIYKLLKKRKLELVFFLLFFIALCLSLLVDAANVIY